MNFFRPVIIQGATANSSAPASRVKQSIFSAKSAALLLSMSVLTACGGGGGGGNPEPPAPVVDSTAPVITLNGATPLAHAYGEAYVELGATALDAVDGAVDVTIEGGINIDMMNNYTITYTATDKAGNKATLTRTVTVEDQTAPVVTLNGESVVTLGQGRDYNELGATAADNVDGALSVAAPSGSVDTNTIGSYVLTYSVSDEAGNVGQVVRTVNIIEPRPFITTWQTTTDGEEVKIQILTSDENRNPVTGYNYTVDWGDGSDLKTFIETDALHIYDIAGTYEVKITGQLPGLGGCYRYENNLRTVEQWGDIQWHLLENAFASCKNLVINDSGMPDLRLVKSMIAMFLRATNFNSDLSFWDMSQVEFTAGMFFQATAFNQDISAWNVSAMTDMGQILQGTSFSESNYDKLLNSLSQQEVQPDVPLGVGTITHSSAADDARAILLGKGWVIEDGNTPP